MQRVKIIIMFLVSSLFVTTGCTSTVSKKATVTTPQRFTTPQLPAMLTSVEQKSEFIVTHYWDNFNFTDTTLIPRADYTEQAYADFVNLLPNVPLSLAQRGIDTLMSRATTDSAMYACFRKMSEKYLYDPNSPFRNEEPYIAVLRNIVANSKLPEIEKVRPQFQLDLALKNRTGERATDFEYTTEQLKSAFIANISHEFRTPISAITGFLPLIIQSNDTTEKEEYIAIVEENSTRLLRLINSLIHLSELQVGTYVFNHQLFNLSYLIDRLIVDYKPQCAPSVEMINKTRDQTYTTEVVSDENAISVVFSNLLRNALKYTSNDTVSLGYRIDESGCVTCFVSDTGVGITIVQQKQIFDNFYQTNAFEEGIGLGLPLCKLIIQELGGRIWVDSAPEVGTTVYFTLSPIVSRSL